jgi:hypothetical protein
LTSLIHRVYLLMNKRIQYISELGRAFDTPEAAIEDDKRLPDIIRIYENDLARMEAGLRTFAGAPVTEEMKESWRNAIAGYKRQWEKAQLSWTNG